MAFTNSGAGGTLPKTLTGRLIRRRPDSLSEGSP
jgi:hypothetical protein